MRKLKGNWKLWVTLIEGAALYLFWAIPFRSALNFQEQFQLFLIDWDYFTEHLTQKGGLAVYISEALVQFYNNYWLGAAILTSELLFIQWIAWKLAQKVLGKKREWLNCTLAFIATAMVMIEIGDINTMHSLLIAIIEELTFAYILVSIFKTEKRSRAWRYTMSTMLIPLFIAIFIWTAGPNHYRTTTQKFSFDNVFDSESYELIEYDFLVRTQEWQKIIGIAEQKQPDYAVSICALNLALGMTYQLGERIGEFRQYGTTGLIPPFVSESFSLLTTAEVYFQLGLINTAQRFYFEAMEGLPNWNKSCRCLRRLAETNLINGQYEVARKYLHILQKTIYYRLWATKTLKLIERGEDAIDSHPLYGRLRRIRLPEDFLFSEKEFDLICGRLFLHNSSNRLALQYLLAYPLLDNDAEKFEKYLQVAENYPSYNADVESFRKFLPRQ